MLGTVLGCNPVYTAEPDAQSHDRLERISRRDDGTSMLACQLRLVGEFRERASDLAAFFFCHSQPVQITLADNVFVDAPERERHVPVT